MFSSSQLSYLSILPSDLQEELLLLLPPKEILSKVSKIEDFKRLRNQEIFWKKVWRKWVSSRLPDSSKSPIWEIISWRVKEAKELTPEELLREGSRKGILFYVLEALCYAAEQGANISANEEKALRTAAAKGYLDIVSYLVERGANISAREDEALYTAAAKGHLDIVSYLVERGANISARADRALFIAAFNGHLETMVYLIEKGANVSAMEDIALLSAAAKGSLETVIYLVEHGANVSVRDNLALWTALYYGHFEIVQYLIESGASISLLDRLMIFVNSRIRGNMIRLFTIVYLVIGLFPIFNRIWR